MIAWTKREQSKHYFTINLRASPEQRDLIDRAARLVGKYRSDFMLKAACDRAPAVVLDQIFFNLDANRFKQLSNLLDATPGPIRPWSGSWPFRLPGEHRSGMSLTWARHGRSQALIDSMRVSSAAQLRFYEHYGLQASPQHSLTFILRLSSVQAG